MAFFCLYVISFWWRQLAPPACTYTSPFYVFFDYIACAYAPYAKVLEFKNAGVLRHFG
jgi:hypothetical protein